jgi:hypothetical protein
LGDSIKGSMIAIKYEFIARDTVYTDENTFALLHSAGNRLGL